MTNVRKIDFGERTWAAHAQDHWLEMAGRPAFPDYLRVVFVAYGRHAGNGHAILDRGELGYFLVRKDGTLPERRTVWRAVQDAMRLGFLADGSQLLCLVVSSHDVQGGIGDPEAPCRRDHSRRVTGASTATGTRDDQKRFTANVGNDRRHSAANVGNHPRRSRTNVGNDRRRSTLSASLSSPPLSDMPAGPHGAAS